MRLLADLSVHLRHHCLHFKSETGESYFPPSSHLDELRYSLSFICSEWRAVRTVDSILGSHHPLLTFPSLMITIIMIFSSYFFTSWQSMTQTYNQFCLWSWRRKQKVSSSQDTEPAHKRSKISFYKAHPYILYEPHQTSDKTQVPFFSLAAP